MASNIIKQNAYVVNKYSAISKNYYNLFHNMPLVPTIWRPIAVPFEPRKRLFHGIEYAGLLGEYCARSGVTGTPKET
jgi:hypothetical protein